MIHIEILFFILILWLVSVIGAIIGAVWRDAKAARQEKFLRDCIELIKARSILRTDVVEWAANKRCNDIETIDLLHSKGDDLTAEYMTGRVAAYAALILYVQGRI